MSIISSLFLNLDLFGLKPKLYFKGHAQSSTNFGIFLSGVFLSLTTLCFIYFGQDFYFKMNPTIIYNEQYESWPEKFVLDPETMPILVEINSPYADEFYTDRSVVEARVSQLTINKTLPETIVTVEEHEMEICTPDHVSNVDEKTKQHFLSFNLNNYFCIPKNIKNLTAQGAFDQPVYQAIKIAFHICNNETYFNKCQTAEFIKNKLNRGFMGYYFKDLTIDPGAHENPYKPSPKQVFTNFVLNSQKELDIFLKNNYIETDDGKILSTEDSQKITNYDTYLEFNFMQENEEFLMVYLRMAQKRSVFKRNYAKFQDLIAQVGGFVNLFWLILVAINFLQSNLIFIRDIVHDIFIINFVKITSNTKVLKAIKIQPISKNLLLEEETSSKERGSQSTERMDDLFKKIDSTRKQSKIWSKKFTIPDLENLIKSSKNMEKNGVVDLKLGFVDFLHYYFGIFGSPERSQKKALIKKGIEILKSNLDVTCMIQKFYEIEKLKVLLLDEDQLRLFDSLPKPELELIVRKNQFDVITRVLKRKVDTEKYITLKKRNV